MLDQYRHRETSHKAVGFLNGNEFHSESEYRTWRPRGTLDWLLIFTVGGTGRAVAPDGAELRLEIGTALLFAPETQQCYHTAPGATCWHLLWFHFQPRPHWIPWLGWPAKWKGCRSVSAGSGQSYELVRDTLRSGVRALQLRDALHEDRAANALERALIELASSCGAPHRAHDERISRAATFLAANLHRRTPLDELARRHRLSLTRFAHLFREQIGEPPAAFAERLRLESAANMLRFTSEPVAVVADRHGFEDPFYFSKRFRKHFGITPSNARKPDSSSW
jgi:AraC family transcriptional regulator of arabinose operon